jgi:hypothetical protein
MTRKASNVMRANSKSGVGAKEGAELMLGRSDTDGANEGDLLRSTLGLSVGLLLGVALGRSDGD